MLKTMLDESKVFVEAVTLVAESFLDKMKEQEGFGISLLKIVGTKEIDDTTRLSAALYFKNLVKKYWASVCLMLNSH